MQDDLLRKEDEFYKENEKLEKKTKELMKKVNDVMKIQDSLIKETQKTSMELKKASTWNYDIKNSKESLECLKLSEDLKNEDLNLPGSVNEMGKRGAICFYRAKIKSLQDENANMQIENRKKNEEVRKLQREIQTIGDDKEKWFVSYNSAKNTIGKLESQVSSLNSKLQIKDNEMTSLKKEIEQVKKELKNSNLGLGNFEVRLNRAYEENEKLKGALKCAKDEEKELKELYKKQISELTATMKRVEHHKIELINGFKKQLQLIDILKKQKMYLETYKIGELSEIEYLKILDWKVE